MDRLLARRVTSSFMQNTRSVSWHPSFSVRVLNRRFGFTVSREIFTGCERRPVFLVVIIVVSGGGWVGVGGFESHHRK